MSSRTDKNKPQSFVWSKIWTKSEFEDKDEFLDIVYWGRQIIGIIMGMIWGVIPLQGMVGLALFGLINAGLVYLYSINFQNVDEEAYGGIWEIIKEGFMTSFACFLVLWILFYSGLHFDNLSNIDKSI